MAFDHSRRRWFGTCPCRPVPRGLPSSVKQLRTTQPFGLSRSWRTLARHPSSWPLAACSRRCSQNTRCCSARRLYVDRIRRNFGPMRRLVKAWQRAELMGVTAKVVIYEAFIEGRLDAPEHLTHSVHDLYFEPKYEEFRLMIVTTFALSMCHERGVFCQVSVPGSPGI